MSSSLKPFLITGYNKGLVTSKKPFLIPNEAWSTLENAYVWRDRELKREGNQLLGRLQRNLTSQSLGATVLNQTTYTFANIFSTLSLESTAELRPGTLVISIGAPDTATFTDNGDGTFTVTGLGVSAGSYVNYATGRVVLVLSAAAGGATIDADFSYYPSLPGMGIWQLDLTAINEQQTIWFDTKYAYVYSGTQFQEFIPGTTWNGTNFDFFWAYNWLGANNDRLLFVTNFNNGQNGEASPDPMYYTDSVTWTSFTPALSANPPTATPTTLFQAKILIMYYGRMLALNTWEGTTAGGASSAINYYNRCRFCALPSLQIPYPATDQNEGWRQDVFGRGGFLDAPTNESITGATFVKNTLVVDFEFSTWQLRYVGEYGLPFIWERVSSDFGSGSTFSGVLFDNYRLNIGDVGITRGNSIEVKRIDPDIPDQVFNIQNEQVNQGAQRIWGVRDFQRELVFWNFVDSSSQSVPGVPTTYPNKVLLYNYRDANWAIFRDSVTCFGTYQLDAAVDWNSTTVTWDDEDVTWDSPINQQGFPAICKTNQQGFVHLFGYKTPDDPSLSITAVASLAGAVQLTISNHTLFGGEIIYIQDMQFVDSATFFPVTTSLNNTIYSVQVVDANTIELFLWNSPGQYYYSNFSYTPTLSSATYIGGGKVTLFPRMNLITKDINLFQQAGLQTKMSRIDFLIEPQPSNAAVTINLILNSSQSYSANILISPKNLAYPQANYLSDQASEYLWFSYFQTLSAQYFRIQITYDDDLMNTLSTHETNFTLYAINAWTRPGGRFANPS